MNDRRTQENDELLVVKEKFALLAMCGNRKLIASHFNLKSTVRDLAVEIEAVSKLRRAGKTRKHIRESVASGKRVNGEIYKRKDRVAVTMMIWYQTGSDQRVISSGQTSKFNGDPDGGFNADSDGDPTTLNRPFFLDRWIASGVAPLF